ncbi:MAG: zf-TFIIB domain-containing protein [Kofleriaceae bacterium]
MICPRCETVVLVERERDGLLVDVCGTCRGVWLDRGELEKLISRATRELEGLAARRDDTPARGVRYHDDDDDDDDDRRHPKKKRRWFDSLGDLFD